MKRNKLSGFARALSVMIVSLLIGVAMTRFVVSQFGMIPSWMAASTRNMLEALRVSEPIGVEDIMDASLLATLVVCWIIAASVMFTAARFTRETIRHLPLFLAFVIGTYVGGLLVSHWINDVLLPPTSIGWNLDPAAEPEDFFALYLLCLHSICWIGVLAILLGALTLVHRLRTRSHRKTESTIGK
jgi:hypothetical protein